MKFVCVRIFRNGPRRSLAVAVVVSVFLHALTFLISDFLAREQFERAMYRVRLLRPPRFERKVSVPRRGIRIPKVEMERLEAVGVPEGLPEAVAPVEGVFPGMEMVVPPHEVGVVGVPGEKGKVEEEGYRRISPAEIGRLEEELPGVVEEGLRLEDVGRHRSVVLIDPEDRNNLRGYLHIPTYVGLVGNWLAKFDVFLRRGVMLPTKADIRIIPHLYDRGDPPDPGELRQFPLLLPGAAFTIDDSLAVYLAEGGFAMLNRWAFQYVKRLLQRRLDKRVEEITITLEHPLFHSFYDITEYNYVTVADFHPCPSVLPLDGIEVDGRLVAVSLYMSYEDPGHRLIYGRYLRYNPGSACVANQLYVNILVYGLTQPGSLGEQYVLRAARSESKTAQNE